MSYKISWPALLQKAEEEVAKAEEEFYSRDDPMTEIDKVRGTEMAYYEKAEEAVADLEAAMQEEGGRLIPTHATPTSKCPRCGKSLPTNPTEREHHITQHDAESGAYSTPRTPFQVPEETPMREEVDRRKTSPVQGAHDAPADVSVSEMTPRARDLYNKAHTSIDDVAELHQWNVGEKDEAPLDAKAVKSALDDALSDADSVATSIETLLEDIEGLDYDDIDKAVEVVNNLLKALKDAQQVGFPQAGPAIPGGGMDKGLEKPKDKDTPDNVKTPTPPEMPEKGEA